MEDDGVTISVLAPKRGTPVRTNDGLKLGVVRRVEHAVRENIFDGIVVEKEKGERVFVDGPEIARIAERWETLTITAAEAEDLPSAQSRIAQRSNMSTTVRRTQRSVKRAGPLGEPVIRRVSPCLPSTAATRPEQAGQAQR